MGLWDPKWDPKNSGWLRATQGMGGELRDLAAGSTAPVGGSLARAEGGDDTASGLIFPTERAAMNEDHTNRTAT